MIELVESDNQFNIMCNDTSIGYILFRDECFVRLYATPDYLTIHDLAQLLEQVRIANLKLQFQMVK